MKKSYWFGRSVFAALLLALTRVSAADMNPLPTGYVADWLFSGALTINESVVTAVLCTNFGTAAAPLYVEFYNYNSSLAGSTYYSLTAGNTVAIAADDSGGGSVFYLSENLVNLNYDLDQGMVRVSSKGQHKLVCEAKVLDANNSPPSFSVGLPAFNELGDV